MSLSCLHCTLYVTNSPAIPDHENSSAWRVLEEQSIQKYPQALKYTKIGATNKQASKQTNKQPNKQETNERTNEGGKEGGKEGANERTNERASGKT